MKVILCKDYNLQVFIVGKLILCKDAFYNNVVERQRRDCIDSQFTMEILYYGIVVNTRLQLSFRLLSN